MDDFLIPIKYPVELEYNNEMIKKKRENIRQNLDLDNDLIDLHINHLETLFKLYDAEFFKGQLSNQINKKNGTLTFELSNRMKTSAGKCIVSNNNFIIRIAKKVLLDSFNNQYQPSVNGINCHNRIEALLLVFEHELIHLAIYSMNLRLPKTPIYSSHGSFFKQLAFAYFQHTKTKHNLQGLSSLPPLNKSDFTLNQSVSFVFKKQTLTGIITKLNPKRAAISTSSGLYQVPYHLCNIC